MTLTLTRSFSLHRVATFISLWSRFLNYERSTVETMEVAMAYYIYVIFLDELLNLFF
jgi:hypothetical protein